MNDPAQPILVAACGNIMAGDDAFGPLVARAVRDLKPAGVEVVDLDINPTELLYHLAGREALIVVDAVSCPDARVGELIDIDWFDTERPALMHDDVLSSHGLSLANQIDLAQRLGQLPNRVRLIGVSIDQTSVGRAGSDLMRRQVPPAARAVADRARRWAGIPEEPAHA